MPGRCVCGRTQARRHGPTILVPTYLDDDIGGVEDLVELAPDAPALPLLEQVVPPLLHPVLHLHDARVPVLGWSGGWVVLAA